MKTEQELLTEIDSFNTAENELIAYNFVVKSFLNNLSEITSVEEFVKKKQNNEISKSLLPRVYLYTYNLNKQKVESITYLLRNGYDRVEIADNKIINYTRTLIFYSGSGCCGGGGKGAINDEQSFENQLRTMEYDPATLEKTFSNHRLLDGKWVKTDLKTNDIVNIEIEKESHDLPDSFKELLPEVFKNECGSSCNKTQYIIGLYSNTSQGKIIKFVFLKP